MDFRLSIFDCRFETVPGHAVLPNRKSQIGNRK